MRKFFALIKSIILGTTVRKKIVKYYFATILIGALFFLTTLVTKDGTRLSFSQAFFTSATAFTDNGLSVIDQVETLSIFGHFITLVLIQIGGLGIMAFKVFGFMFIGRRLSINDRMLIFTEQSQSNLGGMVKLIKTSISVFLLIQLLFIIILSAHFFFVYNYDILEALWHGFYYTISSTNSAGYSLYSDSLNSFSHDYLFQTYIMIALFIGGIGFPIIYEFTFYIKRKLKKERFKFSLYAKLTMSAYFIITFLGIVLFAVTERNTLFADGINIDNFFALIFQVNSFRSAGFTTIPLDDVSNAGHFLISILMFIGVNPASTGGGIRTTTIAIIVLYIISSIKHSNHTPEIFNRRIGLDTIKKSFIVFTVAAFLVIVTLISILAQQNFDFFDALIESVSSFGTIGLSFGITDQLNGFNQFLVAAGMIMGRVGILGTLLLFTSKKQTDKIITLPEENITIG